MKSKNFIRTLISIVVINLIFINLTLATTVPFSCVPVNSWYYNDIKTS